MSKVSQKRIYWLFMSLLLLEGCNYEPLYSDLSEHQANEVKAELQRSGIVAIKERVEDAERWRVSIKPEKVPLAMDALKAAGLPRFNMHSMGDIFKKDGFVSSPVEERARYVYALSQELATTLMQIDGVVSARVHVALPDSSPFEETTASASVSVVIIHRPTVDLLNRETDIKAIIMDGVERVNDVNRVTVKFFTRTPAGTAVDADDSFGQTASAPILNFLTEASIDG